MKDFRDFELLLASDECIMERDAIKRRVLQACDEDGSTGAEIASTYALEVSRYELRKYHEWLHA